MKTQVRHPYWHYETFFFRFITFNRNKLVFSHAIPLFKVEPRFNEPLCNEILGITNDSLCPNKSKLHGKEPRYNPEKTSL